VRLVDAWFNAVERGSIRLKWMYPETAVPSRRLVTILLWVFGIIVRVSVPAGQPDRGVQGRVRVPRPDADVRIERIVNQLMSGFMITYSRALRPGNYVKIGDVTGTVTHLGVLSTKIKTARREEVTIPNAVVVSQTATDYTRFSETEGVLTPDVSDDRVRRAVAAGARAAVARGRTDAGTARRAEAVRGPGGAGDFYVNYTLLVSLERQDARVLTLNALHGQIQDVFNEHGVQIMSPHYEQDPKDAEDCGRQGLVCAACPPEDR
jgi:hypothetical protein